MSTCHPSSTAGTSQSAAILAALQASPGVWIAMPELSRLSGSYNVHSRIADLRRRGHRVEHRNVHRGRTIFSSYRLL